MSKLIGDDTFSVGVYGDTELKCPYCSKVVDEKYYHTHWKCRCGEKIFYNGYLGYIKPAGNRELK